MQSKGENERLFLEIINNIIQKVCIKQGTITEVNKEENTCSILLEELVYENVPINILNQKSNMVVYPALETSCNVFFLEAQNNVVQLISFQDAESVVFSDNESDFITEIKLGTEEKPIPLIKIKTETFNINSKKEIIIGDEDSSIPDIKIDAETITIKSSKEVKIGSSDSTVPKVNLDVDETNLNSSKLNIKSDKTIFNDGTNGGMVIANKVTTQLNNSENVIMQMLTALKTISVPTPAGPYPFLQFFSAINAPILTQSAQIENTKITQ